MTSVPFSCTRLSSEFNDWQVLQIIRFVLSCPSSSPHLTVINGTTVHIFHKLRFNVVQMLTDGNFWSKNSKVGHGVEKSRDGPEDITGCEIVPVWRGTARFIVWISCLFLFLIIYCEKHVYWCWFVLYGLCCRHERKLHISGVSRKSVLLRILSSVFRCSRWRPDCETVAMSQLAD